MDEELPVYDLACIPPGIVQERGRVFGDIKLRRIPSPICSLLITNCKESVPKSSYLHSYLKPHSPIKMVCQANDIVILLDGLTAKSQSLQGPASQISIVNIALAVSGFGPIPVSSLLGLST